MTFKLGPRSIANMKDLHPTMVRLSHAAIALSAIDWGFSEPLCRTLEQQREKVRLGYSKTLNSNHLIKADGYGHAVDCVPWIDGKFTWGGNGAGWPIVIDGQKVFPFATIADAWRRAAVIEGVGLTWGGVWDRDLRDLPAGPTMIHQAMLDYQARRKAAGRSGWVDGPHIELRL